MRGLPGRALPGLQECLRANLEAARLTNPNVVAVGVALNTSRLERSQALRLCQETADALGLPCQDPIAMSAAPFVDRLIECVPDSSPTSSAGR
jgi:uncharacterized NAD-dependent epimerase/dehydratase family protein